MTEQEATALKDAIAAAITLADASKQSLVAALLQQAFDSVTTQSTRTLDSKKPGASGPPRAS